MLCQEAFCTLQRGDGTSTYYATSPYPQSVQFDGSLSFVHIRFSTAVALVRCCLYHCQLVLLVIARTWQACRCARHKQTYHSMLCRHKADTVNAYPPGLHSNRT